MESNACKKYRDDLFVYVKLKNPLVSSFGKFDVTEETNSFKISCEMVTCIINTWDLKPIKLSVNKKDFVRFKRKKL